MSDTKNLSSHERRMRRIILQQQKIEGLAAGSEERAMEEAILTTMLRSAIMGTLADAFSEPPANEQQAPPHSCNTRADERGSL